MRCTRRYRKSLHTIGLLLFSYFFYELYILQFTSVLHRRCFSPPKNCSRGALTDLTCYDLDVWTVFLSAETRAADFCSFYNVIVHWEVIWNIAQCASETQTNNPEKCYFFLRQVYPVFLSLFCSIVLHCMFRLEKIFFIVLLFTLC